MEAVLRAGLSLQVQVQAPPNALPPRFDPLFFQLADILRERFTETRNAITTTPKAPEQPSNQATFTDGTGTSRREVVHLLLRAQLEPGRFVLEIEEDSTREPLSFEALRPTLQEMGGELVIQHWPGQGVRAGLRVPLRSAASAA